MKYESLGWVIGAVVGAILTGACVYITKNPISAAISIVCTLLGGWIGKVISLKVIKYSSHGGKNNDSRA